MRRNVLRFRQFMLQSALLLEYALYYEAIRRGAGGHVPPVAARTGLIS